MRLKDLSEMINKLEQLKLNAQTSLEIVNTLEDIKENLEYLQSEVKTNFFFVYPIEKKKF